MRWVIALLVLCACGVGFIVYPMLSISVSDRKLFGGFFIAIGVLNMLFYSRNGRKFFAHTQSIPPYFAKFWARGGERGVQLLFLGFGIILTVAGGIIIILGAG